MKLTSVQLRALRVIAGLIDSSVFDKQPNHFLGARRALKKMGLIESGNSLTASGKSAIAHEQPLTRP